MTCDTRWMSSEMPTDVPLIRPAAAVESDRVADLMWRVRAQSAAVRSIAPSVHPLMDMRTWMSRVVFAQQEVWVAVDDGAYVGLLVLGRPDWLEHLYIDASHTGRGLGAQFVDLAKKELGGPVQLWTFQSNLGARRFYERHGFVAVETTDGDNEEGQPDVRYRFTP
jgi:GNAT superfamily N-acetyltransferase